MTKDKTPPVYKDFEIKQTYQYQVFGKSFASEYEAKRFGSKELLRLALHETGLPIVSQRQNPVQIQDPRNVAEGARGKIDDMGEELRDWLLEHVHALLPVLNTLAEHHPKQTAYAVETPDV